MSDFGDREVGSAVQPCTPEQLAASGDRWIEIELVGDDDMPIVGERYRIELGDGRIVQGTLGESGRVRIEGLGAAVCKVGFPDLDGEAWEPAK